MAIVNSVTRNVVPKVKNSLDAACNSYIMDVIGAAKGIRKGNSLAGVNYQSGGKVLPTHPIMKDAKISQEVMASFHEAQVATGLKNPYGLTEDGIPIVSIFESSDTAVDAMGRAVILKRNPRPPVAETPSLRNRIDIDYAYAK